MNRRLFIQNSLAGVAALGALGLPVAASAKGSAEGFKSSELQAMEATAAAFMNKHNVPGLSVAISKEERLVYVKGFGMADKNRGEEVTPNHLFRIASVTKPITSVMIFSLVEAGKLNLSDQVFCPDGLLGADYSGPYGAHVEEITIEHLLTHTAGGWQNDGNDPMFSHPSMDHKKLIAWTIAHQPLVNPPGAHYAYSNFGYCILGRVIEKLTGKSYAEAVAETILKPCGITGVRIGGNTLVDRAANEVVYYDQDGYSPYGMNVRRMDSHGGWLATATDLTRFLVRIDDFPVKRDILKSETIRRMTTASSVNSNYAKGWAVNRFNNWWHAGSLPGTSTSMVRTSGRFCWAALTNTRKLNSSIGEDLDNLMWQMVGKISVWPSHDLFG